MPDLALAVAMFMVAAMGCNADMPAQDRDAPGAEPAASPPEDLPSTPHQAAPPPRSSLVGPEARPPIIPKAALDVVAIGLNQEISRLFTDSNFIPPDTMGAVGPAHIVEIINGNFEIFDKTFGNALSSLTLDQFWITIVGLTIPSGFTFDPRIVYDPASQRWFAISIDGGNNNNIYLARSDTDDPTGDWDGFRFAADTQGAAEFHDYDTLGVDADGLYICTNDFGGGGNESCYSIPKADLLLAAPTIANMTRFEATPMGLPGVNGSIQPVLDFGPSDGRAALLGSTGSALVRSDILGAGAAGATLGTVTAIAGDPGHAAAPAARQPHPVDPGVTIENVTPRLVANVFELGDSMWAVHSVLGTSGSAALRWYEIDEVTNTVLQTGLIEDADEDYIDPSIAVNAFGDVVIGYTCSGPNLAPSACMSVGTTSMGATTFEPPFVVAAGAGHYFRDFGTGRNRWGDYSATVIDPVDPCTFWTFQEFVAVSAVGDVGPDPRDEGGLWGTQVTEITFRDCAEADVAITKDDLVDPVVAGTSLTYEINVENMGPSRARDVQVIDTLPAGVTFDSVFAIDWNCIHAAGVVTCDWLGGNPAGSLLSGEAASPIFITVDVAADLVFNGTTSITNTAQVSSNGVAGDPDLSNNTDMETTALVAEADVAILDFMAVNPPDEVLVGEDVDITLRKHITNLGPSAPVDTELTITATPPPDSTVIPMVSMFMEYALGLNEIRQVDEQVTINCGQASNHVFMFDNEIMPINATDPDLSNNDASTDVNVECVVPVIINIKPGSFPNSVNPGHATVPLAVLTTVAGEYGTPIDFDATTIDPLSVRFGTRDEVWNETGGAFERHDRGHISDSRELDEHTRDGDLDMVLHFRAKDTGIMPGDTEACVKGEFTDMSGTHAFFGCDSIRTVPQAMDMVTGGLAASMGLVSAPGQAK